MTHKSNDIIIAEKSSESCRSQKPVAWNYNNWVEKNKNKHTTSTFPDPAANIGLWTTSYGVAANGHPSVRCEGERAEGNMKWYITPVFLKLNHIITLYQRARNTEELCRELRGQWNELRIFSSNLPTARPVHTAKMHKLAPFMQYDFTTNTHALASFDLLCEKGHLPPCKGSTHHRMASTVDAGRGGGDGTGDGPKVSLRVATAKTFCGTGEAGPP